MHTPKERKLLTLFISTTILLCKKYYIITVQTKILVYRVFVENIYNRKSY